MYQRSRNEAAVAFVYIAEAHTTDGWQMESNIEDGVLIANHVTIEDRFDAARAGVERLGLTMPVLVDRMDDAASNAFAAWPERIYVVDEQARIAHAGGPGPFEFDPDAAAAALDNLGVRQQVRPL
jgi:iodothyronine deiodinase-like protein